MKKNQINTFSSNKNEWKGIKITKNAINQILFLINLNPDGKGIRLGMKKSGCAGFRYTIKLVTNQELKKEKNKEEIIFFCKNIPIYISYKDAPFLEGITLDLISNDLNKSFKFYNDKIDKLCGCGESFAIN